MLKVGIVGLPNAGKSTLFNALSRAHAPVAGHPFTTVDRNVGQAVVPDPRLERLGQVLRPERVVPAHVQFVDIAGLVRGAHRGEGLGNRFLAHVREMDALLLVLRAFDSPTVPHLEGSVDPTRDLETLITELALADLETLGRAAERAERRAAGSHDGAEADQAAARARAVEALVRGEPVRSALTDRDLERLRDAFLLTSKPVLLVLNIGEEDAGEPERAEARHRDALPEGAEVVAVCAKLEEEVEDLADAEAEELLDAYGIERDEERIDFYSIESNECRAWLVPEGTTAAGAAEEIHTDMARGFIKADAVPADALIEAGSVAAARDRGAIRAEGRDYRVADGDVLTFRFRA